MPKKLSKKEIEKYKEALPEYRRLQEKLADLEVEGKKLKEDIRKVIDKVKMKNVLSDIVKQ